jgi:hypothetical protein
VRSRFLLTLALALLVAACDSSSSDPTGPTTSLSTTTTTIENDTCERVAADTVRYLERLLDTLDETRLRELTDVESWPSELRDLQRSGKDLDLRVAALRCDRAAIQQYAFAEADLTPHGPLSEELLELLLSPETTTTSTSSTPTSTTTSLPPTTTTG